MKLEIRRGGMCGLVVTIFSFSFFAHAGNDTTITSTITGGGTCTVSAPPTLNLGSANGASLIGQNWARENVMPLTLTLTQCSGIIVDSVSPTVSLGADAVRANTDNKVLYTATGTTANGFGVVVFNKASPAAGDTDAVPKDGIAWQGGRGTVLNADTPVNLSAAVACGPSAVCTTTNLREGSLVAHVTFTFAYR